MKGLGPGCVSALRIAADGPARRHGISLRSAAAAYPAANASPRGTLRPQSRSPAAIAPPAADAPPSFGRQRLPMTQRTKNGQHFAGRFCEVMS